jgi:hypothetical protein
MMSGTLWIVTRLIALAATGYVFLLISLSTFARDVAAPYWFSGVVISSFPILVIWLIAEALFARRKTSAQKTWIIFILFTAFNLLLSPVWVGAALTFDKWLAHF